MEKLGSGKIARIKRRLIGVEGEVLIKNDTDMDILLDQEENVDGSKPSLTLRIKRVLRREEEPPRGVL